MLIVIKSTEFETEHELRGAPPPMHIPMYTCLEENKVGWTLVLTAYTVKAELLHG